MTGAISPQGDLLCDPIKVPTGSDDPAEAIIHRITSSIERIMESLRADKKDVLGIGVGSTGPLDLDRGLILDCPQLPTMHHYPLRKTINEYFGIPVYINNDANCLIFGEVLFGAASGHRNVLGFTLGTGLGAAVIIDRKIFNGSTGTAGEIWISPYKSGIIEDYTSGAGVSMIYKSISGKQCSAEEVFQLAKEGDKDALHTWAQYGEHLAVAIAWAINMLDPEAVVLGGSVAHAHAFFMPALKEKLKKFICRLPSEKLRIVIAQLGDNAGFIGAASLVLEH